jgi:hypothetical protein
MEPTFDWQFDLERVAPSPTSHPNFTILALVGRNSIPDIFFETCCFSRFENISCALYARNSHAGD